MTGPERPYRRSAVARPLRIEFDGAWYHLMNRGAGRRTVFPSIRHEEKFLRLLGEISETYRVEFHGYCLMGNHYHLQVHTPKAGLARAMRQLNGTYTQWYNRQAASDGPLFRGRYQAVLINAESHLCQVSRYIHLNPVDAELVCCPEEYTASSYRAFLGLDFAPEWLHTAEILSRFGPNNARENYRRFVESGIDAETKDFFSATRRGPVLGPKAFRERMSKLVEGAPNALSPEVPDTRLVAKPPSLDAIAMEVCRAFRIQPSGLRLNIRRNRCAHARGAVVHLGRVMAGQPLHRIARWMGYRSPAAASKVMSRLRAAMAGDADTRRRVEAAKRRLTGGDHGPRSACRADDRRGSCEAGS